MPGFTSHIDTFIPVDGISLSLSIVNIHRLLTPKLHEI